MTKKRFTLRKKVGKNYWVVKANGVVYSNWVILSGVILMAYASRTRNIRVGLDEEHIYTGKSERKRLVFD